LNVDEFGAIRIKVVEFKVDEFKVDEFKVDAIEFVMGDGLRKITAVNMEIITAK
jgi:hypothetical protein